MVSKITEGKLVQYVLDTPLGFIALICDTMLHFDSTQIENNRLENIFDHAVFIYHHHLYS
jgi:hypothetical protein